MADENDLLFDILKSGGAVIDIRLNEDGTPNGEEFRGSLAEAINSIPPVWVREKNDPEWGGKQYYNPNQVIGALLNGVMTASGAYTKGGTEQHEDEVPEDLTGLVRFLKHEILAWKPLIAETIFESSLCEIGEFVWTRVQEGRWFTDKTCDPETAVHNGLISLRNEAREFDRFNRDFEARWAAEHGEGEKRG